MKLSDFTYNLPPERIAKYPPKVRGDAKLLVLDRKNKTMQHRSYRDFAEYVQPGDVVVLNNTKVIKARLRAKKENDANIELLVLEKHSGDVDLENQPCIYKGKLNQGESLKVKGYTVKVSRIEDGIAYISNEEDLFSLAARYGEVPIPPYLKRDSERIDEERYQTVFAEDEGSIAAPTASLNFTDDLRQKINNQGGKIAHVTLHVGMGTFAPVREEKIEDHKMHEEHYFIPADTLESVREAKKNGRSIFAVGTTVTRTLEHAASKILNVSSANFIEDEADIFIYPGYEFKIVDHLLTNFHAPNTTVLLMAAAFAGWGNLKSAYEEALSNDYKFLSYGDSMLMM
ncbi:tRNA preQ1(34) S-adenosylmethionine ribosyltransferase-isomerase QueA [candidate division WWE3 bacterium]|uniref:S-adenosylmethionine:tRNA ribosyltransferase-isomerase n=1 Tax=candidate division WWE3 bacterium TaxID=2053526 RepID=A0A955RSD7_UNCKA|nr:tRNA preQ1(34) S-adenosylmethionine ribosyltransferase-isomerase QueA [candidate division WWE3 bacterium]